MPPLRERLDDIPILFEHFLDKAAQNLGKKKPTPPPELFTLLKTYAFPGNIRELKNLIERIILLEGGETIRLEHLPLEIREPGGRDRAEPGGFRPEPISAVELRHIVRTLEYTGGNKSRAAQILGISESTSKTQYRRARQLLRATGQPPKHDRVTGLFSRQHFIDSTARLIDDDRSSDVAAVLLVQRSDMERGTESLDLNGLGNR
mgnify:CR=1 FL=1